MANCTSCAYTTEGRTYYQTEEANLLNHQLGHLVEELRAIRKAISPQDAPESPADPPPPPTTRPVVDSAPDPESRAKPSVSKPKAGAS